MTVTSQRPLKILIRYKKRSLSTISLFLKVKWPSDSIVSRAVNSLPNVLVLVNIDTYIDDAFGCFWVSIGESSRIVIIIIINNDAIYSI